jgi:probable F420-dependent oxidoreductase
VRLGVFVSNEGGHMARLGVREMAVAAEAAGADGLWVSDHLLMLDEPTTEYPFSPDGRPPWEMTDPYLEALTCCSWIAAATQRCRVGTAILILPQRNVLEVAKAAATIDQLSGGRFVLGVGAGWYRGEMEALGHDFGSRGKRFDEMLRVLRDAWGGRPAPFAGAHVAIPDRVVLEPRPAQEGGVPILIGGMSAPARRRAAGLGDGWLAIASASDWDPTGLAAELDDVRGRRADADAPFEAVLQLIADPRDPARIARLVHEAAEVGFGEVIVEPPWADGLSEARAAIAEIHAAA